MNSVIATSATANKSAATATAKLTQCPKESKPATRSSGAEAATAVAATVSFEYQMHASH